MVDDAQAIDALPKAGNPRGLKPAARYGIRESALAACLVSALLFVGACQTTQPRVRHMPLPMRTAIDIHNENIGRITGTLRAVGSVDGRFVQSDGTKRSFHVDASLFFLAPHFLRLDLKKLGSRELLVGSNDDDYWVYTRADDDFLCGRYGEETDLSTELPVRPDQLAAALGLTMIFAGDTADPLSVPIHRVVEDYQQLLFLARDDLGKLYLEREYWLDRYAPNLIGRIVFRDADGFVQLESTLSAYRQLSPGGPWLPGSISAEWPKTGAQMRLQIVKWSLVPQVDRDGVQFKTPSKCNGKPAVDPA